MLNQFLKNKILNLKNNFMKAVRLILAIIFMYSVLSISACKNAGKDNMYKDDSTMTVKEEQKTEEQIQELKQEKEDVKNKMDATVKKLDTQIDELNMQISKAKANDKKDLELRKTKLEKDRDKFKREIDEIPNKMDNEWKDFKRAANEAIDSVQSYLDLK